MTNKSVLTVLFLAANPANSVPSRLDHEAREISEGLLRSRNRDCFIFEQKWAVRSRDVQQGLLEYSPQIIHFAGNREPDNSKELARKSNSAEESNSERASGLIFEDNTGRMKRVSAHALANLFELFSDQVNCVLLNGCYTENQAQAIVKHIPYVVGTKQAITDSVALTFALGFYDALGAGRSIEFAYKLGCTSIQMEGLPEHMMPVLHKKTAFDSISTIDNEPQTKPKDLTNAERRLQEKREDLEEEYQLIRKKLKWLKKELTVKADVEAKYELSQRIQQYEAKLCSIEDTLEPLEKRVES